MPVWFYEAYALCPVPAALCCGLWVARVGGRFVEGARVTTGRARAASGWLFITPA